MTNDTQTTNSVNETIGTNRPDYIAKQYRVVRIEDGWRTRKEHIGAVWKGEDGALGFRTSGAQIIEGDVYFYPFDPQKDQ